MGCKQKNTLAPPALDRHSTSYALLTKPPDSFKVTCTSHLRFVALGVEVPGTFGDLESLRFQGLERKDIGSAGV